MIKREYKTKSECVGLFMEQDFDRFPSWVVTDQMDFYEVWEFRAELDEYEAEEQGEDYGYVNPPMWNTWFIPSDSFVSDWIERNEELTMDCGFTLIYHEGYLFAIGVDGAGYSFRDSHFTRLYDAMGMQWHDED